MTKPDTFANIDINNLGFVTGGAPQPQPAPPPDFANRYSTQLSQDAQSIAARARQTNTALDQHQYGTAARNFGALMLNEVGIAGDAIAPIRALVG